VNARGSGCGAREVTANERRSPAMANQIRTHKYTHAARTDSKWNKMASKFSKLLENVFSMFYQILNFSKSYTKLLEMLSVKFLIRNV
jgi:hypothetical protein